MPLGDVDEVDSIHCPACGAEIEREGDEGRNPDDD
jgi:hypothetical protein